MPLSELEILLREPGFSCHILQNEISQIDAEVLEEFPQFVRLGAGTSDFVNTAALMSLMDLVISVDTSIAHLAGALGRPTWILLPYANDWRWLLDRDDTPWYPTAKLFRQRQPGDWSGVLQRVVEALHRDLG